MSELLEVMAFDTRVEAEIAQGLLEEQGIESIIRSADCGECSWGYPWCAGAASSSW